MAGQRESWMCTTGIVSALSSSSASLICRCLLHSIYTFNGRHVLLIQVCALCGGGPQEGCSTHTAPANTADCGVRHKRRDAFEAGVQAGPGLRSRAARRGGGGPLARKITRYDEPLKILQRALEDTALPIWGQTHFFN